MSFSEHSPRSRKKASEWVASFVDLWQNPDLSGSKIWKQKSLKSITFFACRMQVIPNQLLTTWPSTLEGLFLPSNYICQFPSIIDSPDFTMPALKTLNLLNNEMKSVPFKFIQRCPCLKELVIAQNPLSTEIYDIELPSITRHDFFDTLQIIDMSSCRLHHFPSFLDKCNVIEKIIMSGNSISTFSHAFVHSKMNLKDVNLSNNKLTSFLPADTKSRKRGKGRLIRLDLSHNMIGEISFDDAENFTESSHSLTEGEGSQDRFSHDRSDSTASDKSAALFSGNELNSSTVSPRLSIEDLAAEANEEIKANPADWKVTFVPESEKEQVSTIAKEPKISKPLLRDRTSFADIHLRCPTVPLPHVSFLSLRLINASANRITSLEPFVPLLIYGDLQILILSINRIREIPKEFSGELMGNLTRLDLSYNCLSLDSIPPDSFTKMAKLECLCLNGNNFTRPSPSLLSLRIENKYLVDDESVPPTEIVPGKIFLGSLQSAQSLYVLKEMKITHIISVLRLCRPYYPEDFKYLNIEADDSADFDLMRHFPEVHQFMDEALESGGTVMVHCAAGISRSATLVISYIMKNQQIRFRDAYSYVRGKRSIVSPNSGFQKQLEIFERKINVKKGGCIVS
ncbi:leucine-rich repeat-containing protein [Planoprotostelium fungivorum]|uniref:Leucine-rich repeat-containing protein n=1 Tax=Planoprotostelium fungivorum TaxID=1890364 RepID=A0A2P6NN39_9EUKA|nr:leucine-rich repeat-containing protein [Planoprotostelium fungivorum]